LAALDGNDPLRAADLPLDGTQEGLDLEVPGMSVHGTGLARQFVQHLLDGIREREGHCLLVLLGARSTNQLRGNGLSNLTMPPAASAA